MSRNLKRRSPEREPGLRVGRLGLAGMLVALCACAPVGPDFVKPETPSNPEWLVAELEQFETDATELAEWWTTLQDPVLDELIAVARLENNTIRIAGLRVVESQARLNIALGSRWPQQQVLAGDVTAVGVSEDSAGVTTDTTFTEFNVGASVVWEIDFWGRFRRGIEAADADLLASIASFDEAIVIVTATVADIYALIRSTEEQLRLARESYEIQERSYEIAEILYRNGSNSELDALQARTQLLGTAAVIPGLEQTLQQLKVALAVLLGRNPGNVDDILKGEGALPDLPDSVGVGIPANMLATAARCATRRVAGPSAECAGRRSAGRPVSELHVDGQPGILGHRRDRKQRRGREPVRFGQSRLLDRAHVCLAVLQLRTHPQQRPGAGCATPASAGQLPGNRAPGCRGSRDRNGRVRGHTGTGQDTGRRCPDGAPLGRIVFAALPGRIRRLPACAAGTAGTVHPAAALRGEPGQRAAQFCRLIPGPGRRMAGLAGWY